MGCSKEQHLFEIEIFKNIKNFFIVTFDQFNASLALQNKRINAIVQPKMKLQVLSLSCSKPV